MVINHTRDRMKIFEVALLEHEIKEANTEAHNLVKGALSLELRLHLWHC